ncbi:MAG TPA: hypothetical protein VJV78_21650 [Polyangiales bacterium]|nr:hypothetical protein [Polyangiales bacterium]
MTTRSWIWVLAACLVWTGFSGRAAAGGSPIVVSMGDLRWGMTESEVATFAKRKIADSYGEQMKKADAGKQAKLKDEMKRAQAEVEKSHVAFEGSKSRWDSSPIAGEFNYGEDESMLVAKGGDGSTNYYFFRDGRLWKWYKAYDQASISGGWKKFSSSAEEKFGKGRAKKGALNNASGDTQWLEYLDRSSRLRAADNSKRGVFALIFDDMSVVRELAAAHPQKPSRLAGADDDDESVQKSSAKNEEIARAQTKKSVFAHEQRQESETEYQARQAQEKADARERQARAHAKKEDAKQGQVLKQLDGLDDKDPLGGL